jgi:hypothetical protein
MVAYECWRMLKAPAFRLEGALNRRRDCGRLQRKSKKILNRGNEPKDLLETQHLAVSGAKNELKTNSILSAKSAYQSGNAGIRCQVPGVRFQVSGVRCQVQEEQVSGFRGLGPEVRLPASTMRPACRRVTARPNPLARMYQEGRKARNGAGCTANRAADRDMVVTSRPSTFDFSTSRN